MANHRLPTVAIIGAGVSGLTAIKACIEEGLSPTCFEKLDCVGGLWAYTEQTDRNCVHHCTICNTSKEMTCFSDFPIPKEYPIYLSNKLMLRYLQNYAQEFGLLERIRFKTEVVQVRELKDVGSWTVSYRSLDGTIPSPVTTDEFDFVMVGNGLYHTAHMPSYSGMKSFRGSQVHSCQYRNLTQFDDQTVLLVGIGTSACDIAMDLSAHAKKVYMSTRSGTWLLERMTVSGYPVDMQNLTRAKSLLPSFIGGMVVKALFSPRSLVAGNRLGTAPCHSILNSQAVVADGLHSRIAAGLIQVVTDVEEISDTSVRLKDGKCLESIDAIIYCTGFDISFPFLDNPSIYPGDLYKTVFPVDRPVTIAFLGQFRVKGPTPPIVELQARWAAGVFSGRCSLPSNEYMRENVSQRYQKAAILSPSMPRKLFITFHYVLAMLEYSKLAGVYPDLLSLAIRSPRLAWQCLIGPCVPAQFRLFGVHQWKGAQQVIENAEQNAFYGTQTRLVEFPGGKKTASQGTGMILLFAVCAILAFVYACT